MRAISGTGSGAGARAWTRRPRGRGGRGPLGSGGASLLYSQATLPTISFHHGLCPHGGDGETRSGRRRSLRPCRGSDKREVRGHSRSRPPYNAHARFSPPRQFSPPAQTTASHSSRRLALARVWPSHAGKADPLGRGRPIRDLARVRYLLGRSRRTRAGRVPSQSDIEARLAQAREPALLHPCLGGGGNSDRCLQEPRSLLSWQHSLGSLLAQDKPRG